MDIAIARAAEAVGLYDGHNCPSCRSDWSAIAWRGGYATFGV